MKLNTYPKTILSSISMGLIGLVIEQEDKIDELLQPLYGQNLAR